MKQRNNKSGFVQGNEPPLGSRWNIKNTTNPNAPMYYCYFNMDRRMLILNSAC